MALPQSSDVLEALDKATDQFPDLVIIESPHCGGLNWIADPATHTVYIRRALSCDWSASLIEALADLTARCGTQDAPRPTLTLLRGGGEGDGHQSARTGS